LDTSDEERVRDRVKMIDLAPGVEMMMVHPDEKRA
jgi:hypothetical protein